MQMPEVRNTQVGNFENENRIAVPLGAAIERPDIGRDITHAHVLVLQIDARGLLVVGPAMQHIFDRWIRRQSVVRRVRMIHGRNVR
jgi:hypothetical protein